MTNPSERARILFSVLSNNVADYFSKSIDRATFCALQRKAWDSIDDAGEDVRDEVLRLWRDEAYSA